MKGQNHYGQSLFGESVNRKKYSSIHRFTHSPLHPFTDKGGFTLIETIMVMVIAVILAAVVAVRWSPFDTIKLNSATRKVAGDIRYAQKVAISTQATYAAIAFNTNGYTIYDTYSSVISRSPGDPCSDSGGTFVVDFSQPRCSNYSGVEIEITSPTINPIAFSALGTPVEGRIVEPTFGNPIGTQTVTVKYKGTNKDIMVEAGTGRVSY